MVDAEKYYFQRHFSETDQEIMKNQRRTGVSRTVPVQARDNSGRRDAQMLFQRMHLNGVLAMPRNSEE
jgi:hypothetical protein